MGLFWFTQGVGSLLGTASMEWFRGIWFFEYKNNRNINCRIPCENDVSKICHSCHLDYYFFVLGGIQVLGLLAFIILAWKLDIGRSQPQRSSQSGASDIHNNIGSHRNRNSNNGYLVNRRSPDDSGSSGRNSMESLQNPAS